MTTPIFRPPLLRALALASLPFISTALEAGHDYRDMSCRELWHERNAIYAAKGYCFESERALRTFGRACFPPYGRLSPREQEEVRYIKSLEARRGCRN
jgi:hypothetical protein